MLLLDRRNRAHPEDGVDAPGHSGAKRCPMELRAEQAVRAYFSLDKTRPLGHEAFFLDILALPPKDRVVQFMFMAEMLSITTGLLLFFVQTLATFEEGMSKLGLVSAVMATAAVMLLIGVICMLMMFGLSATKGSSSVKNVVALKRPTAIYIDNKGAGYIAEKELNNKLTKHIDIRYHFVRQYISEKKIELFYVPSAQNIADLFTKALCADLHRKVCDTLYSFV